MNQDHPLSQDIKTLAAERRSDSHPAPEVLLDYHLKQLAEEQRERLQDHLAVCARCSRAVLDMATFPQVELGAGVKEPPPWGKRQTKILEKEFGRIAEAAPLSDGWKGLFPKYLAAGLAALCLLMAWRLASLESRLENAQNSVRRLQEGPHLRHSFEILSLQPTGSSGDRSGSERIRSVSISEGPVPVMLNTFLSDPGPYLVELVDGQGVVRQEWEGLRLTSRKNLTLILVPGASPVGDYELRILVSSGGSKRILAGFPLTIEP